MATVTICSDFGAQKNKVWHCFHRLPICFPWSDGTGCHDLHFLNVDKENLLHDLKGCSGVLIFEKWFWHLLSCLSVIMMEYHSLGFPDGLVVKNPPANEGDVGLIPWLGRFPGEGNGNPLQDSCLGNPMDRGAWRGYSSWGYKRVRHNK